MDRPWILSSGQGKLLPLLENYCTANAVLIACFTDSFRADRADRMLETVQSDLEKLLELRVFNEKQELWIHRSSQGGDFHWRVASEENMGEERRRFCFETRQLLDLGEPIEATPKFENGLRVLRTEGGRRLLLPIQGTDRYVRIMNYVDYDEDGVANASDYRLIGFAEEGKSHAG